MSLIHRYKSNGFNIVLDINSGCIHLVDEVTYEVLPYLEEGLGTEAIAEKLENKYNREDIETSVRECNKLKEDGMLFTKDVYENVIEEFSNNRQTVVKALCLHIAHDCNLACRYCFAEEGEYHGRRALMSYEVGKKALDFLIANSGSRKNLEVDFFGGEPLMNWQVVKDLVKYGREQEKLHNKKFRFTLTTNGVLLNDEVMEFCNKEMGNVVLSVDGRKEVHDYMRPFRKGAGSYDLIMPKFQKFAESRNQDKYYVRGTFTHHNLDFSKDVLHLADLGFKQISVEPVVAADTEEYAIREEDSPQGWRCGSGQRGHIPCRPWGRWKEQPAACRCCRSRRRRRGRSGRPLTCTGDSLAATKADSPGLRVRLWSPLRSTASPSTQNTIAALAWARSLINLPA